MAVLYTSDSEKVMRYTDEVRAPLLAVVPARFGWHLISVIGYNDRVVQVDRRSYLAPDLPAEHQHPPAKRFLHRYGCSSLLHTEFRSHSDGGGRIRAGSGVGFCRGQFTYRVCAMLGD